MVVIFLKLYKNYFYDLFFNQSYCHAVHVHFFVSSNAACDKKHTIKKKKYNNLL